MECRIGCGACCIALSISSPLPGMPEGKPAGIRCAHLDADNRCELFASPERPDVCKHFSATPELCGDDRGQALARLARLESETG